MATASNVSAPPTKKQQIALSMLDKEEAKPGHNQWQHVEVKDLIAQLRRRVMNPNRINQGKSGWCGPAAALRSFAKDAPQLYVDMVLDLVHYGRAKFHHGKTHHAMIASKGLRSFDFGAKTKRIRVADWIPLATMREHLRSANGHATGSTVKSGTFPKDVVHFYRAFGYSRVEDVTSGSALHGPAVERIVRLINQLLAEGWQITLRINERLVKSDSGTTNAGKTIFETTHNHFVDLISPIHMPPSAVSLSRPISFSVFCWGKRIRVPDTGTIDLDTFAANFYGFICARY